MFGCHAIRYSLVNADVRGCWNLLKLAIRVTDADTVTDAGCWVLQADLDENADANANTTAYADANADAADAMKETTEIVDNLDVSAVVSSHHPLAPDGKTPKCPSNRPNNREARQTKCLATILYVVQLT